jgi:hypothetical protein
LVALALATAKADALETTNAKLRAERDAMRERLKEFQGATVDELLCLREALWAERAANAEFRSAVEARRAAEQGLIDHYRAEVELMRFKEAPPRYLH